jgi:hypothetical protein
MERNKPEWIKAEERIRAMLLPLVKEGYLVLNDVPFLSVRTLFDDITRTIVDERARIKCKVYDGRAC